MIDNVLHKKDLKQHITNFVKLSKSFRRKFQYILIAIQEIAFHPYSLCKVVYFKQFEIIK